MARIEEGVCLVTGATTGIGKATAQALSRLAGTLVVHGRNPEKVAALVDELKKESGNDKISGLVADFTGLDEVRRLAQEFRDKFGRLDVLINNVGMVTGERRLSRDGYEMQFAVNHLAPFLLTNSLIDLLQASAPSRVVTVASASHNRAKIDLGDLQLESGWSMMKAYGRSKLGNVLFSNELSRRMEGTGVTANSLHPGGVNTNIGNDAPGFLKFIFSFLRPFMLTPDKGAETSVYLASSPEVEGVSGQYFAKCKQTATDPSAQDRDTAANLWAVSEKLTGIA